jgi:Flp pilus assembly protein TadD
MRILLHSKFLVSMFLGMALTGSQCSAQTLRIPLPKKSKYTPVQQLNRDGVKALQRHEMDKAKRLFYKAYLIDPNDPFTLNNLGYLAEAEGDIDRAQRYYDQAQANTSEAVVDKSTEPTDEGKPVAKIAGRTSGGPMRVNELNSQAVRLLNNDRAPEADLLLQEALKIDSNNPFTLNNMGFAREKEGELEDAINSYNRAARTGSQEPVVVTINKDWRGKPISEVAAKNAENARKVLEHSSDTENRVARLNLRGVSAMNRNDRKAAREYFEQAFKLDPKNSFTINNMGYLAELSGDRETAQSYYSEAQDANRNGARVSASTRPEAEGRPVGQVAGQSTALVEANMAEQADAKRRSGAPPTLRTRDNRVVVEPPRPATPPSTNNNQANPNQPNPEASPQPDQQQGPPTLKQRPPDQAPATNQPPE